MEKAMNDKIQSKINKIKLALMIGGTLSANPASAAEQQNDNTSDKDNGVKVTYVEHRNSSDISVDNHDNQFFMQSREQDVSVNGKNIDHTMKHAFQNRYDLADGYLMVESDVSSQQGSKSQKKSVSFLVAPDGKTYDCAFLHNGKHDLMPAALPGETFAESFPDQQEAARLEQTIKETLGVESCDNQAVHDYNSLMIEKKLQEAKNLGYPEDVVQKIGVFMQKTQETMEDSKVYIGTINNAFSDHTVTKPMEGDQKAVNQALNQLMQDKIFNRR